LKQTFFSRWRRWSRGDPMAFRTLMPDADIAGRIRAVQINAVMRNSIPMMAAAIVNALTLLIAMSHTPYEPIIQNWAFVVVSLASFLMLRQRSRRNTPRPQSVSTRGIRNAVLYAFAMGALWGGVPAFFFVEAASDVKLVIVCLSIGMLCGGSFALATIPVAATAFVAPIVIGSAFAIAREGAFVDHLLAVLLVVYTAVLLRAVSSHAIQLATRVYSHARDEAAAQTDALTHLPNRVSFRRHMTEALARVRRYGEGFALFCFDLDNFKTVNDTMGHSAGDKVLIEVANRLRDATRDVDFVARLAGDEFALIAARIENDHDARTLAERINAAFQPPFLIDGREFICTISIGIAIAPVDGLETDLLMRHADAALYATKNRQRGTYTLFGDRQHALRRRSEDQALRRALADRELQLVFQPIVEIATRRTTGFEALLRWNHPERGLLLPADFIPLAEESGLIDEIGAWVLREAIRIASAWPEHLRVTVNISALQFRNPVLDRTLRELVSNGRFLPHRLELELTESALVGDSVAARDLLQGFRQLGVRIALDDFGTGYSSLTNILDLPFDRLKIDRAFTANVLATPACGALVKAIVGMSADLNFRITAEGVETAEQLAFLEQIGCPEAQGYLFSRPKVAADLEPMFFECREATVSDLRGKLRVV
jgi:diguanylate cyclase (GGDEF)-like protein